jgi:bacterioferritin-associated ferredoxin
MLIGADTTNRARRSKCRTCGDDFHFHSKTMSPRYCEVCRAVRQREINRLSAERRRRKRGVNQVKGVIAACEKCRESFVRNNIKHIYCVSCGGDIARAYARRASKEKAATREGRNYSNKWRRDRYRRDPAWRVASHMKGLMHRALTSNKQGKSWRLLVPYSLQHLMDHLEKQFLPGMSWSNYGNGWHIDHKMPRSKFSYRTPDDPDFKACWALSNLQPLWALDNIRKGAKVQVML